jgi:hypothetical protein
VNIRHPVSIPCKVKVPITDLQNTGAWWSLVDIAMITSYPPAACLDFSPFCHLMQIPIMWIAVVQSQQSGCNSTTLKPPKIVNHVHTCPTGYGFSYIKICKTVVHPWSPMGACLGARKLNRLCGSISYLCEQRRPMNDPISTNSLIKKQCQQKRQRFLGVCHSWGVMKMMYVQFLIGVWHACEVDNLLLEARLEDDCKNGQMP